MSLFTAHLAAFDAPPLPAVTNNIPSELQFKRPLAPSAKRKHAALRGPPVVAENQTGIRVRSNSSASHVRSKTETSVFAPADENLAEPANPSRAKKARLDGQQQLLLATSLPSELPKPNFPIPRPEFPLSFSFSGTRQETQQLTEQFERMRIQEEDEKTDDNPAPLSRSALFVSHNSQPGRRSLLEQESEERINHVRQINHMIGPSSANGDAPKVHLPILTNTSQPDLNCITPQTLADLLTGIYNDLYDAILVIDCRFAYEFEGGHIRGALNFPDSAGLDDKVFDRPEYQAMGSRLCLVFHCEFSSHRGPRGYKKFRSLDRKQNADHYPHLDFPEMYLLEGGYRKFWEDIGFRSHCEPCAYVEMKAQEHLGQCKEAMKPRGRSVSKVTGPIRRHFSMSCSNILAGAAISADPNKPLTAREQLRFDREEPEDDITLLGGNRFHMSNNR